MKKLSYTLLPAIAALIISPLASAAPNKCPSANEIKNTPIMYIENDKSGYIAGQYGYYYDTNVQWTVGIYNIPASSWEDAISNTKKALDSIAGNPTPIYNNYGSFTYWVCQYSGSVDGKNVEILAFTYDNYDDNISKIKSMKKAF